MRVDKTLLAILIPVAVTFGAGLIEMRVAIGRLETAVADVEHRVERLENRIDSRVSLNSREPYAQAQSNPD